MMKEWKARAAAVAMLLCASAGGAQLAGPYSTAFKVDWVRRTLNVSITMDSRAPEYQPPSGRARMESMVDRDLAALAKDFIFSMPVDSYRTVEATVADGTIDVNALLGLLKTRKLVSSGYAKDLRSFTVSYSFDLTRVADLYVRHREPATPSILMDFAPSKPYTGVIIYAKGALPVRGEYSRDSIRPCLFPRIWDEEMNLILERNFVSPSSISKWGIAGYSDSAESVSLEERVGDEPLKILAYEVFGTLRTDLVITRDDALRLLSRPENVRLITEGRVVIVCDVP